MQHNNTIIYLIGTIGDRGVVEGYQKGKKQTIGASFLLRFMEGRMQHKNTQKKITD
jgi:hypothetical protein